MGSGLVTCLTRPIPLNNGDIPIARDAFGVTRPRGLCVCDSMMCARCGPARCRVASVQLQLVLEHTRTAYPTGAETMLTLTFSHLATDTAAQTVDVLYRARAALRASAEWRALKKMFGIAVDVSSLDVTFGGPNGTHPHFHILLVFERLPLVSPRASIEAALHELVAKQDQQLLFKHGFVGRWTTTFAPDENAKPLHGRTPKEIADDPTTARIVLLRQLLDEMPPAAASMPFRDASPAFQRAFLARITAHLRPAWARCVEFFMLRSFGRKIDDRVAFDRLALELTPADHAASYLVGWGLEREVPSTTRERRHSDGWELENEIASTTSKGQCHLRLLDLIGTWRTSTVPWQQHAAQTATQLYRDFLVAVRGRQWLIGLTKACRKFDVTDERVAERAEQLCEERLSAAKENGDPLVTPLDYVIRRRHWPVACRRGLGPTFSWIDATADRLEAMGYRTANQRAAAAAHAVSTGPPAADRQLSLERLRAQGARTEPVLDLEEELQRQIDRYLEGLAAEVRARDRARYESALR